MMGEAAHVHILVFNVTINQCGANLVLPACVTPNRTWPLLMEYPIGISLDITVLQN